MTDGSNNVESSFERLDKKKNDGKGQSVFETRRNRRGFIERWPETVGKMKVPTKVDEGRPENEWRRMEADGGG